MKIVVDDKIPYILPALHALADDVVVKAGAAISPSDVHDATILVVRTRTRCDRALLDGSSVRLVVTATIGFDHLDTAYLDAAGIEWHNCPGCNATSVAQYVASSLLVLRRERGLDLSGSTLGIVGVGHVGTAVVTAARRLGVGRLLLNDPPREAAGDRLPGAMPWTPLAQLLADADIISLHTPLTTAAPYPTRHLIDADAFGLMRRRPVLINAGRGGLVDEEALLAAMATGAVGDVVLDTWEGEPHIRRDLLNKVYIGTPHIAGYSADGKANATRMALTAICRYLGRPMTFDITPPSLPEGTVTATAPDDVALQLYDPRRDSSLLKASPEGFEQQRGSYPLRRERV